MGWIHDTGYGPAYLHEGFPVTVLSDGGVVTDPAGYDPGEVAGWKSGCECGWRSALTYSRTDFPSRTGDPPDAVDGSATRSGAWSEWREHLFTAMPELIVADVVNVALQPATDVLDHPVLAAVVAVVRERGVPWTHIADAAGVTTREAKWAWSQPGTRPAPQREPDPVTRPGRAHRHGPDAGRCRGTGPSAAP